MLVEFPINTFVKGEEENRRVEGDKKGNGKKEMRKVKERKKYFYLLKSMTMWRRKRSISTC